MIKNIWRKQILFKLSFSPPEIPSSTNCIQIDSFKHITSPSNKDIHPLDNYNYQLIFSTHPISSWFSPYKWNGPMVFQIRKVGLTHDIPWQGSQVQKAPQKIHHLHLLHCLLHHHSHPQHQAWIHPLERYNFFSLPIDIFVIHRILKMSSLFQ